jgi:5-methylcytosine-specific restriction enzyme subunit McrC
MTPNPRTLRLVEYRPREVRLRRAEVDALLAAGPTLEVVPTRHRGRYRVTARGVAGVLLAPGLRVVIRPKIPSANLFHLIDPSAPPESATDVSTPEPGTEAFDFLARRLSAAMSARAAAGLRHGYVERADRQTFLQGRLDVAAQVRESPATRDRFHVSRDEFSVDIPVHRLTKAVAETVLTSPLLAAGTRTTLRAALLGYADVASTPLEPVAFEAVPAEPDRPLLDLCRLLIRALQPGERAGDLAGPVFLLDLERMFEQYVERGLSAVPGLQVQREFTYHKPVLAGQPPLVGRPDLVVRRDGKVRCAIDAKWKSLDGPPLAGDVHQALAYAVGLGCPDVRLVYPGRRYLEWRYELTDSDVTLTVHCLRVVGPRARCERSIQRLLQAVR